MSRIPFFKVLSLTALVASLALAGTPAQADEIHVIDPETCATRVMPVEEITSETWAEVKYRTRARGPEQSVAARDVVKVVRQLTGASLMDAKKMVEGCPATLKEGVAKEEADKMKAEIEGAGGSVELK